MSPRPTILIKRDVSELVEIWLKHGAPEPIDRNDSRQPVFTPFTVAPSIQNVREVQRALRDVYPQELGGDGIGGTVGVYVYIDEEGTVRDYQVEQSSGHRALDGAAVAVRRCL